MPDTLAQLTQIEKWVRRIYAHYAPHEIERATPTSQLGCYKEALRLIADLKKQLGGA